MLFSVLSLVLLKLSQFLYIRHSTYSQCSFSWFTILVPQFFYFLQQTKLLLEIKKSFKILFIQSNGHHYHQHCCLLSSMIQHRSYTQQNWNTFLVLKSERTHLLPCLSVTCPKNISTSFTFSPLTSPWVWEQVFISSTTSSSCSDNYPGTSFISYFWHWR